MFEAAPVQGNTRPRRMRAKLKIGTEPAKTGTAPGAAVHPGSGAGTLPAGLRPTSAYRAAQSTLVRLPTGSCDHGTGLGSG